MNVFKHLIDRIRVPIRRPWRYLVSSARYSDLLVENREIFIPHLYLAPLEGGPCRNFVKMFDADKTRMIGLLYGEKTYNMLSRFHLIPEQTDRQTVRIAMSISRVSVLTRDKNMRKNGVRLRPVMS